MNKTSRIDFLVGILNQYRYEYYTLGCPTISDETYDMYFDELKQLEEKTGYILPNSPTQTVGYSIVDKLNKVFHPIPMLSLDKIKFNNLEKEFKKFDVPNKPKICMTKLDGLTLLLTYRKGRLYRAETRGNGVVGEEVTHNAFVINNIPKTIDYKNDLYVIGEVIIDYETFNKINENLDEYNKYANPRNLVSGTIRQLDSRICKKRQPKFIVFGSSYPIKNKTEQFYELKKLGFTIVPYNYTTNNIEEDCKNIKIESCLLNYPYDGVVIAFNNIEFGESLGRTQHHPKHSIAIKFTEDLEETILRSVEWNVGRTGRITPVAHFDPIELCGTTVSQATINNLRYVQDFKLGIGDVLTVYKANEIIPTIKDNLTKSNTLKIIDHCPICGTKLEIREGKYGALQQLCPNEECDSRVIRKISHYVARDAMNIDGLSIKTIEALYDIGLLTSIEDLYELKNEEYKDKILSLDKFGEKKYNELIKAIECSKECKLENFIFALGIPNVGLKTAKDICKHFYNNLNNIRFASKEEFLEIKDIGDVTAASLFDWFCDEKHQDMVQKLQWNCGIEFIEEEQKEVIEIINNPFKGKEIYFTGSFELGKKKELQDICNKYGIIFATKFKKSNDYLVIGNKKGSSKSENAKDLGVEVLTETEFVNMLKQ